MAKNIVYLLGAGASANAIPVMKKLPKAMKYFYKYVINLLEENKMLDATFSKLNPLYEEILEEIEQFGTPDTLAKILMHKGEDVKLWHLKDLISCYMLYEQLDIAKTGFLDWGDAGNKARTEIFGELIYEKAILLKPTLDNRYVEFLSAALKGRRSKIYIPENMNIISWNYDHQIEKALGVFAKDGLKNIQERFKIFPLTDIVDYTLDVEEQKKSSFNAQLIKVNGTAGFSNNIPISNASLFDINNHEFNRDSLDLIGKLLFRVREYSEQITKLNFAWETDSESVVVARESAAANVQSADAVVVIGYSFPNFNREVDRQIFEGFDIDKGTIYIQDPYPDEIIEKLDGVKQGLKKASIPVRSGGSFTIPNEFWE